MGRRALVLVIALLLAGVAAFGIYRYLRSVEASVEAGQEQVVVFRAAQPIAEGTEGSFVLQGEGVVFVESTEEREDLPADAITSRQMLEDVLSGRVAAGPISENAVLVRSQWVELVSAIKPLSELIPEGKQAITVAPSAVQGVNGFVRPGDRVNIIVTLDISANLAAAAQQPDLGIPTEGEALQQPAAEAGEQVTVRYTRFVLQGVPVLAVGSEIRPPEDVPAEVAADQSAGEAQTGETPEASTVFTLEVTPEQAERLVFAQDAGSLYFTLVPADFVEVATRGVTIETLFEGDLVEDIFGN